MFRTCIGQKNCTYLQYKTCEYEVKYSHANKSPTINPNITALRAYAEALRSYYNFNKAIISCTHSDRRIESSTPELGMMARFFPCMIDISNFNADDGGATYLFEKYWQCSQLDHEVYLKYVVKLKRSQSDYVPLFAYNYDNFDELSFNLPAPTELGLTRSNSSKAGVFDIVLNASSRMSSSNNGEKNETLLLFRIDYSPHSIDHELFKSFLLRHIDTIYSAIP